MDNCLDLNCKYVFRDEFYPGVNMAGSGVRLWCTHPDVGRKIIVDDLYEWLGDGGSVPDWCPGPVPDDTIKLDRMDWLSARETE